MSIFKKIGRALGKVAGRAAKIGLSAVTHGVSDKVLNAIKVAGLQKKRNAMLTRAAEAIALRHAPETKTTTTYARETLRNATRGAGSMGNTRDRTDVDAGNALPGSGTTRRVRRARTPGGVRRKRTARGRTPVLKMARPRKRKAAAGGSKRAAPASFAKFAQRAKELAAQWRAAGGKEGTGQSFFEWKRGK